MGDNLKLIQQIRNKIKAITEQTKMVLAQIDAAGGLSAQWAFGILVAIVGYFAIQTLVSAGYFVNHFFLSSLALVPGCWFWS